MLWGVNRVPRLGEEDREGFNRNAPRSAGQVFPPSRREVWALRRVIEASEHKLVTGDLDLEALAFLKASSSEPVSSKADHGHCGAPVEVAAHGHGAGHESSL